MTKPSRQVVWQRKKLAAGLCRQCGSFINTGRSDSRCRMCLDKKKALYSVVDKKKKP